MGSKNNDALFYTCSLIEYIGRNVKRRRKEVTDFLGKERIGRIYEYADVFHCEPIAKTADEFIEEAKISIGDFDNEKICRYTVPDYWDIGEVYERLIEDCFEDEEILEGDVMLKGRIFGFVLLKAAWRVYRSQSVKKTIRKFQHKEA